MYIADSFLLNLNNSSRHFCDGGFLRQSRCRAPAAIRTPRGSARARLARVQGALDERVHATPPSEALLMRERRTLLRNGILFSGAFAGLEGCVTASVALSAVLIEPELASRANGTLYLLFSIGNFVAPACVAQLGAKRALIISMWTYTIYLAAFLHADHATLIPAAALGGTAGLVQFKLCWC